MHRNIEKSKDGRPKSEVRNWRIEVKN